MFFARVLSYEVEFIKLGKILIDFEEIFNYRKITKSSLTVTVF